MFIEISLFIFMPIVMYLGYVFLFSVYGFNKILPSLIYPILWFLHIYIFVLLGVGGGDSSKNTFFLIELTYNIFLFGITYIGVRAMANYISSKSDKPIVGENLIPMFLTKDLKERFKQKYK